MVGLCIKRNTHSMGGGGDLQCTFRVGPKQWAGHTLDFIKCRSACSATQLGRIVTGRQPETEVEDSSGGGGGCATVCITVSQGMFTYFWEMVHPLSYQKAITRAVLTFQAWESFLSRMIIASLRTP